MNHRIGGKSTRKNRKTKKSATRKNKSSRKNNSSKEDIKCPAEELKVGVFGESEFNSGDGMLTTVWGPSLWHFLHTMSFNYPVNPTAEDKKNYKTSYVVYVMCTYQILSHELKNNFKSLPPTRR